MVSLKKLSKQCNIGQKQGDHRQTKCDLSYLILVKSISCAFIALRAFSTYMQLLMKQFQKVYFLSMPIGSLTLVI